MKLQDNKYILLVHFDLLNLDKEHNLGKVLATLFVNYNIAKNIA